MPTALKSQPIEDALRFPARAAEPEVKTPEAKHEAAPTVTISASDFANLMTRLASLEKRNAEEDLESAAHVTPENRPGAWLKSKGWVPSGPIENPLTRWTDHQFVPPPGRYYLEPIMIPDKKTGQMIVRQSLDKQTGRIVTHERTVFVPPTVPMSREDAIAIEMLRQTKADQLARAAAERAQPAPTGAIA